MQRDMTRWPIKGKTFDSEVAALHQWLTKRVAYLNGIVNAYPDPNPVVPGVNDLMGTLRVTTAMAWRDGFSQTNKVVVDKAQFLKLIGIGEAQFDASKLTIVPSPPMARRGTTARTAPTAHGSTLTAIPAPSPMAMFISRCSTISSVGTVASIKTTATMLPTP